MQRDTKELCGEIKLFYILVWVMVKQVHSFAKNHQSVHLKCVIFFVWI